MQYALFSVLGDVFCVLVHHELKCLDDLFFAQDGIQLTIKSSKRRAISSVGNFTKMAMTEIREVSQSSPFISKPVRIQTISAQKEAYSKHHE